MKIHPVGATGCSMWMDGQRDLVKLIATFCNFSYVPINTRC